MAKEEEHPDFSGTWVSVEQEGLDDFLKALGIEAATRAMVAKLKPIKVIDLSIAGSVTMTDRTPKGDNPTTMKTDGTPEEGTSPQGDKFVTKTVWEGAVLVTRNSGKHDIMTSTSLEADGRLLITTQLGDIIHKRWFVKE